MEMDKLDIKVIIQFMSKELKSSFNLSLLIAFSIAFFLYANELKTKSQTADAGVPLFQENSLDSFFEMQDVEQNSSKVIEVKKVKEQPKTTENFEYDKTIWAKVTAYTPGEESCGKFADGFTSTGTNAWVINGVAVAPKIIPYGSWVHIPNVGYREVDDTGGAMKSSWEKDKTFHVDLRFHSVKQAREWGVRWLPVHIYTKKDPKVK